MKFIPLTKGYKAIVDDEEDDVLIDILASLVAAVSLLKRGSKKAAPSDRMFDQMIADYEQSIKRGRAAIVRLQRKKLSHDS